jgi:hypothetical protein
MFHVRSRKEKIPDQESSKMYGVLDNWKNIVPELFNNKDISLRTLFDIVQKKRQHQ